LFLVVTRECNKIYLQIPVCAFTDAGAQNNMILLSEFKVSGLDQELWVEFPTPLLIHYWSACSPSFTQTFHSKTIC